jgi:hypothetical protein
VKGGAIMESKLVKLLLCIGRVSNQMKKISTDLDKIFDLLQDKEIALFLSQSEDFITKEDYE